MNALRKRLRIVVHPAMMTARKAGDGVHTGALQRRGERVRVELRAYVLNGLMRMKIQVNLPKRGFKRIGWGIRHLLQLSSAGLSVPAHNSRSSRTVPASPLHQF